VINSKETVVNLIVRYIDLEKAGNFLLVIFDENAPTPASRKKSDRPIHPNKDEAMQTVARRLEDDLRRTKDRLRLTVEQHETSIEELKASNEELQAINEEMRSASEELETSKEELQSVNEELTTVNHELKEKVDELSRVNSDLQNLMVSTDIGTIFLDRELRIKFYTPRARQLFNIIPGDVGRPLEHLTHKLNYDGLVSDSNEVLKTLQPIEREIRDKEGLSYMLRILPYRTLENKIDGLVITIVDTTGLKRAEETVALDLRDTKMLQELGMRLLSSDNIQKLCDEITAAAVKLMGADAGKVQIFDEDSQELSLLAARNIPDRIVEYLRHVDIASNALCGTPLMTRERAFIDFDKPDQPDPDGSCKMHFEEGFRSAQSTPLVTRSGKSVGVLTTLWRKHHRPAEREIRFLDLLARQATDLIEHRRSEESIRESDRLKDEFLATLSHELRNPLAPIRSALEIITGKKAAKKDVDRALETIERQTAQIINLVGDLLDVSRITQGKIKLKKEVMDLGNAIEMAIEANREAIRSKNLILTVTKPKSPIFLEADITRITQIVINLLNNAAKYTQPGGSIWISSQIEGNDAVIRVIDNGIGIEPEKLSRIFDMFRQLRPDETGRSGLGVGLTLVKRLVELHGGMIEAYSDGEGKGSEFVVRLPIAIPLGFVRKKDAAKAVAAEKTSDPKKILIVDDNRDAVDMLSVLLRQDGHQVEAAYDGKDAIALAGRFKPDVILLDIGLPKLDGYEVAKQIRKKFPIVYLIAVSGWGQEKDLRRSLDAGFDRHLVKPVEFEELRNILEEERPK
jgi:two-component system CheB/CheR fusion protein